MKLSMLVAAALVVPAILLSAQSGDEGHDHDDEARDDSS